MRRSAQINGVRVQIVRSHVTPAQACAWAKLWVWLLADDDVEGKDSSAPRGEQEALRDGTDRHEHSYLTTRVRSA
jgi:hypothetical protein